MSGSGIAAAVAKFIAWAIFCAIVGLLMAVVYACVGCPLVRWWRRRARRLR